MASHSNTSIVSSLRALDAATVTGRWPVVRNVDRSPFQSDKVPAFGC